VVDERDMIVSGNWKMHENHVEALKLVQALGSLLRRFGPADWDER